ncbi:MAG: sugar phosphate isomerase/epimerase [Kiritimatiellaeota bacterium]|nr:sugar phosphate isomerase/epimerase [Kiritimatiellota bacterium]
MTFSLSTNWFASRATPGDAMARTARDMGFDALELGYRLTAAQGDEITRCVEAGDITVPSVHAYCPEPAGVPSGHPELYLLASTEPDEAAMAAIFLRRTIEFAKRVAARAIVLHTGRVKGCWFHSGGLLERAEAMAERGMDPFADAALRRRARVNAWFRKRRVKKHLDALDRQLDVLLPLCENAGVALCMENLPSAEAIPNDREAESIVAARGSPFLRYWHDTGHAEIQARMRWAPDAVETALRLLPVTAGAHIHDIKNFQTDHLAPGKGQMDFKALAAYGAADIIRVLEPAPGTPTHEVRDGLAFIKKCWSPQPLSKA